MTQAIIPGCEENPDPKNVIIIDHTKPMKVINMNETKNNVDNIPESFKQFLASGESVIQTCRELMEENARLREFKSMVERTLEHRDTINGDDGLRVLLKHLNAVDEVLLSHNIDNAKTLDEILSEPASQSIPEDYEGLKDFKSKVEDILVDHAVELDELDDTLDEWESGEKMKKMAEAFREWMENAPSTEELDYD